MEKLKVGIIGCGNISPIYFTNLTKFNNIEIIACADLILSRAETRKKEFNIPLACTVEELLSNNDIQAVLNLTIPKAHAEVTELIINSNKHAYCEKPLALSKKEIKNLLQTAKDKNLLLGCAPDTFLGASIQTCRRIIDEGQIGDIVGVTAFMMCHGHESWHPDPEFYYEKGGGPMFDMGPYYLTALINLLGPVIKVCSMNKISFPVRTITSNKNKGKKIQVEVPTHVSSILEFANGAVGTIITSFDVWGHKMPCIEIYGSKGTLRVPDPNGFGGKPELNIKNDKWHEISLSHGFKDDSRGLGFSDMINSIQKERITFRADSNIAFHVLDIMESIHASSETESFIKIRSTCEKPEIMPIVNLKNEPNWYEQN